MLYLALLEGGKKKLNMLYLITHIPTWEPAVHRNQDRERIDAIQQLSDFFKGT